jgi:hypothetical protein
MLEFTVDSVQSTKHQTISRAVVPGTTVVFTIVEYFDSDGGGVNLHIGTKNYSYESKSLAVDVASVAADVLSRAIGLH